MNGNNAASHVAEVPSFYLSVAAITDTGKVRPHNEDAFIVADLTSGETLAQDVPAGRFDVGERGVLLAVADGMGGAQAGEVASAMVVETLRRSLDKAAATEGPETAASRRRSPPCWCAR